jgi:catechol 2,3-dioxygenase-like lactoylglutathione lyase family enzyme/plasmid stabilization system protein ParE
VPKQTWSDKRERQYEHIKDSVKKRGASTKRAKEIAARTVNKERARKGEAREASPTSRQDISSGRRGGLRSGTNRPRGRTKEQLYNEAKRMNISGRSNMNKAQLQRAVDGANSLVRGGASRPLLGIYALGMKPQTLDHVALWVADRDKIADFVTGHAGMHIVDRTDAFTLVGSDARRGKLTLFAEEGPRERGPLMHVALRVSDLEQALRDFPADHRLDRPRDGEAYFDLYEGLRLGLIQADTDTEYDLDHVALYSNDPEATAAEYEPLGFNRADPGPSGAPRVEVGGAFVELHPGDATEPERPLLNHLAMRVESAQDHVDEAKEMGVEIDKVVDAANTLAVFVFGPERVKLEYVEHKPGFALT